MKADFRLAYSSVLRRLCLPALTLLMATTLSAREDNRGQHLLNCSEVNFTRKAAFEAIIQKAGLDVVGNFQDDGSKFSDSEVLALPVGEALNRVGLDCEWKLIGNVLVLTSVEHVGVPECLLPMEYHFKSAPANEVLPILKKVYPGIRFTSHPTLNGFFASGSKESLLNLWKWVLIIDREGPFENMEITQRFTPRLLTTERAKALALKHNPRVRASIDERTVLVDGHFQDVIEAFWFLDGEDRELLLCQVSVQELRISSNSCRFLETTDRRLKVNCDNHCDGPLHLLGLDVGDWIEAHHVVLFADQPEWRITRNGVPTRIVLNLTP